MPTLSRCLVAAVLSCVCWQALCARAQEPIVPIEQEPRHVLKFANRQVRFFDVQLPPGYRSAWHTHLHDGIFVTIEPSETSAQDLGGEPATRPPRKVGETTFIGYTDKPKAHRVANLGAAVYHVTDTEIHAGCGRYAPVPDGAGQVLILENERVRVTRITLAPGAQIPLHAACGLLVAVTEGELGFVSGGPRERMSARPADFKWRESFAPVLLINEGQTPFQAVDIVVK